MCYCGDNHTTSPCQAGLGFIRADRRHAVPNVFRTRGRCRPPVAEPSIPKQRQESGNGAIVVDPRATQGPAVRA